jgi:hypothetical protein
MPFLYAAMARRRCAPSTDGIVLPIAAAARRLLFCSLSIVDENNNNGNDNRVPLMNAT